MDVVIRGPRRYAASPTYTSKVAALNKAIGRLNDIARELDVPFPCWLGGDGTDQGLSYCRECAQKQVEAGNAAFVDGGWEQDNDGCCHCQDCERLLDYTLTEYGTEAELEHFMGAAPFNAITPVEAYHLARVLENYQGNPKVFELLPHVEAALEAQGTTR